jgi:hypothetical protein
MAALALTHLQPLEFEDCLKDSPAFRDAIKEHEDAADYLDNWVKRAVKEARGIIAAGKSTTLKGTGKERTALTPCPSFPQRTLIR